VNAYGTVTDEALERLAERVDRALAEVEAQPVGPLRKAVALREAVEAFQKEGITRILRAIVEHPAGDEIAARLGQDAFVQALLTMHGLVRPGLEARILEGLVDARPWLREHGGDVEFVERDGDVVRLRLTGSCSECTLSELTLHEMVFNAIRRKAPEIARVELVDDGHAAPNRIRIEHPGEGWEPGPALEDLPERATFRFDTRASSVLIHKDGDHVRAWENRCPHQGYALDGGLHDAATNGDGCARELTCPWHGWRFDLASGDCTHLGDARLNPVPVILRGGTVWLRP
jgi:nitrite reductase/ring-hydroxylating ferredoxin subunit/Fe-S cluster biogenesis protein NfuA